MNELRFSRTFEAPRELVFRCLTDPQHLAQFWGPQSTSTPVETITVDARPGGRFETVMLNDTDGGRYETSAVYDIVDEPETLAWTETATGMKVTLRFEAVNERCILHRWTPPEGGQVGALNHAVIHGLDATAPLASAKHVDPDTVRVVLDGLTVDGVHAHFGTTIEGRRLEATDIDWAYGTGPALRGPAHELALALCGRTLPAGNLEGRPLS